MSSYDSDGNGGLIMGDSENRPRKIEKGQKFYTIVNNSSDSELELSLSVTVQDSVLKKLTIKSKPEKDTFIEGIDYPLDADTPISIGKEGTKGLVVTAEYADGKTEDLEYGDKSRNGDTLSVELDNYEHWAGDADNDVEVIDEVMVVSLAGMKADYIPAKRLSFSQYIALKGENMLTLSVNKTKSVTLDG